MRTWSPQQEKCLRALGRWAALPASEAPIFLLTGDAGTGKTTLAVAFQEDLLGHGKSVGAYAYTGKAASVLRGKGFHDAGTFHSHLYVPSLQSKQRLDSLLLQLQIADKQLTESEDEEQQKKLRAEIKQLRDDIKLEQDALANPMFTLNTQSPIMDLDFLIADEVSMIGTRLGTDLEDTCKRAGVKMLLMGDPNQLPPVKDTAHFMDRRPDCHLDEVHRQAKDNPILYLAHLARKRERIPLGSYGESKVTRDLQAQEALDCDQMLVGKNRTRQYYNWTLRKERGYEQETYWGHNPAYPDDKKKWLMRRDSNVEIGEKLMCLRNSREGYFNGSIWFVEDVLGTTSDGTRVCLDLRSEDSSVPSRQAMVHTASLRGADVHFMDAQGAQSMVSAQAVTVHKFQGSEGDHIVLLDESYAAARGDAHKWLYTGITRAREKLTLVVDEHY